MKQKELEPWTAQVNAKQAEIDIAESERALLADKATGAQTAVDEAIASLEKLRADRGSKLALLEGHKKERERLTQNAKDRGDRFQV